MMRAVVFTLTAVAALNGADYKDVNKTVPLNPNGAVTVENHKGSIQISTWDRAEVDIKARIESEPGTPMDRRRFDATEVVIDSSADAVRIRTQYPDWCCFNDDGNNPEVRYTIRMPRTVQLTIHDHRSQTEITGLAGVLHVDTHRGTVRVHFAAFTGNSSVETHRGSVELSLPRNSRFDVQTDMGRHATLDTDFAMMTRSADRRNETMHGAVNGGGPVLSLTTPRGNIRIHAE
jgi:hypothetical protein